MPLLHFGDYVKLTQISYDKLCLEYTKPFIDGLIREMNLYMPNKPGEKFYTDYACKLIEWAERRKKDTKVFSSTRTEQDLQALAFEKQKVCKQIFDKFNTGERNDKERSHCAKLEFWVDYVMLKIYYGISGKPREDIKIRYDAHGFEEQFENALRKEDFAKW